MAEKGHHRGGIIANLTVSSSSKPPVHDFDCQPFMPVYILLLIAYSVVILVGIVGNLCLIIIVKKQKEAQNVTNILIANLSLSDILISFMCIPFTVAYTLMDYWIFGEAMCKISSFTQSVSVSVSIFSLVLIAVERYQLIVNPRGWKPSMSQAYWGICFTWIFSVIISIPFFIFHQITDEPYKNILLHSDLYSGKVACMEIWPSVTKRLIFTTCLLVFQYCLPLCFIFICYLKIFVCLRRRKVKGERLKEREGKVGDCKRISVMLVSIVVTFAACWLPLTIFNVVFDWHHEALMNCHHDLMFTLCHLVAMVSTCINPIFYGLLNKNFQKDLLALVHHCRCSEPEDECENIALSNMHIDVSKGCLNNVPDNI